jgi:hypothetical protein
MVKIVVVSMVPAAIFIPEVAAAVASAAASRPRRQRAPRCPEASQLKA